MNIYKYSRYIYISIKKYNKRKVKSSKICSFLLPTRNFEINHKLGKRSTTVKSHWHSWHRQMQSSSNHDVWVVERRNRFVFQRAINLLGEAVHEGTTLFFRWYSLFFGGGGAGGTSALVMERTLWRMKDSRAPRRRCTGCVLYNFLIRGPNGAFIRSGHFLTRFQDDTL